MAKIQTVVCNKCGKEYPRWRLEREGTCEEIVLTLRGSRRCCGSIIKEEAPSLPEGPQKVLDFEEINVVADGSLSGILPG